MRVQAVLAGCWQFDGKWLKIKHKAPCYSSWALDTATQETACCTTAAGHGAQARASPPRPFRSRDRPRKLSCQPPVPNLFRGHAGTG